MKKLEKQREEKKAEWYTTFLALPSERMEFDRERLKEKMELERARLTLEKEETWIKLELEKKKMQDALLVEQEKVKRIRGSCSKMLASLLDEPSAK